MALDELQDNDVTFTDQGITFVIEKKLFEEAKPSDCSGGSGRMFGILMAERVGKCAQLVCQTGPIKNNCGGVICHCLKR